MYERQRQGERERQREREMEKKNNVTLKQPAAHNLQFLATQLHAQSHTYTHTHTPLPVPPLSLCFSFSPLSPLSPFSLSLHVTNSAVLHVSNSASSPEPLCSTVSQVNFYHSGAWIVWRVKLCCCCGVKCLLLILLSLVISQTELQVPVLSPKYMVIN